MWQWMHGGAWGMGWGLGMAMMVLFWVLVIAAIVWVLRSAENRRAFPGGHRETLLEILQRRYANGEIGRDEYEQKRRDLNSEVAAGGGSRDRPA